jgi:hypothetical protein
MQRDVRGESAEPNNQATALKCGRLVGWCGVKRVNGWRTRCNAPLRSRVEASDATAVIWRVAVL